MVRLFFFAGALALGLAARSAATGRAASAAPPAPAPLELRRLTTASSREPSWYRADMTHDEAIRHILAHTLATPSLLLH